MNLRWLIGATHVVSQKGGSALGGGPECLDAAKPAWPRRGHYLLLALFFAALAGYGSLVPLRYAPLDFTQAIERFRQILGGPVGIGSRTDWVANVLLFVPISYCFLGTFAVDRRGYVWTMLCVPLVLLTCAASSLAIEFTQLWFDGRTPSLSDLIAQIVGAVAGASLWVLIGQTVTDWVRSYSILRRPADQIDWLLRAYFIGLVIYSVLPLDLTVSPVQLARKYRRGKIALIPFSDAGLEFATLYGLFRDVAVFIPVGMLAATCFTSPGRPVRRMSTSLFLGGLAVLAIELAQLLVISRFTATGDLITGTIGVGIGAWLMGRWRGPGEEHQPQPAPSGLARRPWFWLGLAGIYSLFLAGVFCAPFDLIDDPQQIKARLDGFRCVPFASLQSGSEFNAVSEILRKVLWYVPLGALFALAAVFLPVPRPIRRILLAVLLIAAAGIAGAIELAQVFFASHFPDITDVILCPAGAAIGMFVTLRIVNARRSRT